LKSSLVIRESLPEKATKVSTESSSTLSALLLDKQGKVTKTWSTQDENSANAGPVLDVDIWKDPTTSKVDDWIIVSAHTDDPTVQLWRLESPETEKIIHLSQIKFASQCRSVTVRGDQNNLIMVTGCNDGDVRIWPLETKDKTIHDFQKHVEKLKLHISPEGRRNHWFEQSPEDLLQAAREAGEWMNLRLKKVPNQP